MSNFVTEDHNGTQRVVMGMIGTDSSPDYGIKITSSDGSTTIIDGTSDVFKIVATGTQTQAFPAAPTSAAATVTLTALGSGYSVPPMCVWSLTFDNSGVLSAQFRTGHIAMVVGATSGIVDWLAEGDIYLSGAGGTPIVRLTAYSSALNPGTTAGCRYYVLMETGF